MSQLKIKLKDGNPQVDCEITVDGKVLFVHEVDISIKATEAKAVLTLYDFDLEYEGEAETKLLKRGANGEWDTKERLEQLARQMRGTCTCFNGCKSATCDKL